MNNAAFLTKFEAYLLTERRVARNTLYAYKRDVQQFNQFLTITGKTMQDVVLKDIKNYLKHLKALEIGARSVARKISSLKVFFAYLQERFGLEDLITDLSFPKFKKGLPTFLSEKEIETLLQVADSDTSDLGVRNKIMLYLLYVTGMRISELVKLEVSCLRLDTGFITVMGKGSKERMIPLPAAIVAMLQTYVKTVHTTLVHGTKTNFLFPVLYAQVVKHITRQAFWIILNALWEKTGSKKTISPHALRHSLATHMLKNGADLRALQLILGHENIATVEIYTHVETTHLRQVYDKKHPRSKMES
jgi:integrase/recombinase XerD